MQGHFFDHLVFATVLKLSQDCQKTPSLCLHHDTEGMASHSLYSKKRDAVMHSLTYSQSRIPLQHLSYIASYIYTYMYLCIYTKSSLCALFMHVYPCMHVLSNLLQYCDVSDRRHGSDIYLRMSPIKNGSSYLIY